MTARDSDLAHEDTRAPVPDEPFRDRAWRLRYTVGGVVHYTAWTADFPALENLYEQYRREGHGTDHVLERREVLR